MSNPAMPGIVKIGYTESHPDERRRQLDSTGVPAPFKLETAFRFSDFSLQIEKRAHFLLGSHRLRDTREFFSCDSHLAAEKILDAASCFNAVCLEIDPVLLTEEQVREKKERDRKIQEQRLEERRIRDEESRLETEERERATAESKRRQKVELDSQNAEKLANRLSLQCKIAGTISFICLLVFIDRFFVVFPPPQHKADPIIASFSHQSSKERELEKQSAKLAMLYSGSGFLMFGAVAVYMRKKSEDARWNH